MTFTSLLQEEFTSSVQCSSVAQSCPTFATPWTVAHQASLLITNSQSLLKPLPIESVMPSNHFILCHPLLLPSIFPSIRIFSNESALRIRWAKHWSFSFNISPSNEHSGLISFRMDWFTNLALKDPLPTSSPGVAPTGSESPKTLPSSHPHVYSIQPHG